MLLSDHPDTADLQEKVTRAWREFATALARTLPLLPAGGHLDLTLDPTASGTGDASYSVTATRTAEGPFTSHAVSNATLPEGYQLNRAAVADLVALGWSPPGVEPTSGDRFGLVTMADNLPQLATILTRTLRDIYGAPHPAFLVYQLWDPAGETLAVPPLGPARAAPPGTAPGGAPHPPLADPSADDLADDPETGAELREQVRAVIAAMQQTTPERLFADPDGDIGIRAGSAMVFVKVRDNPPLVDVFSPVLTDVKPTEQLYGRLSELTNRMPVGRLYCTNETVWASVPVFGRNFQPSHLVLAVRVMTGLADELDDRLQGEFGGRRFFAEDDHPSPHGSPSTGMYL